MCTDWRMKMDKQMFDRFKELYKEAVELGQEAFTYDGQIVLTAYAKYLIEFYEPKHKEMK